MGGSNGFMGICSSPNSCHCIREIRIPLVCQSYLNKVIFLKAVLLQITREKLSIYLEYELEHICMERISSGKLINLVTNDSRLSRVWSQGMCWKDFRKSFPNPCSGQGDDDLVDQIQLPGLSFSLFSHFLSQARALGPGSRCPLDVSISFQNWSLSFGPKYLLSQGRLIIFLPFLHSILMVHALLCCLERRTLEF